MTPEDFRAETGVSRGTLARLGTYAALLVKWNRAINLVGAASLEDLWRRHMLDSAQLLPLLPAVAAKRQRVIVDLGSGAGFPGLVLAILGAGALHMVEADRRKAEFLRTVLRELQINAEVHDLRIEAMPRLAADVVTARACARLPKLLAYAERFSPRLSEVPLKCIFPKGRRADEELTEAGKQWNMRVERVPSRSDPGGTILQIELHGAKTPIS